MDALGADLHAIAVAITVEESEGWAHKEMGALTIDPMHEELAHAFFAAVELRWPALVEALGDGRRVESRNSQVDGLRLPENPAPIVGGHVTPTISFIIPPSPTSSPTRLPRPEAPDRPASPAAAKITPLTDVPAPAKIELELSKSPGIDRTAPPQITAAGTPFRVASISVPSPAVAKAPTAPPSFRHVDFGNRTARFTGGRNAGSESCEAAGCGAAAVAAALRDGRSPPGRNTPDGRGRRMDRGAGDDPVPRFNWTSSLRHSLVGVGGAGCSYGGQPRLRRGRLARTLHNRGIFGSALESSRVFYGVHAGDDRPGDER